jgi:hypothetical protein
LKVQSARLDYAPQGARVWIEMTASTTQTGRFTGPVVIRLRHASGQVQTLQVPVEFRVLPKPDRLAGHVLICQTPFDGYSTGNGTNFRTAARITAALSERQIQVDFLEAIPKSLGGFTVVLLAGDALARLQPAQRTLLRGFVQSGGRLVIAPDAFFQPTVARANELLAEYGLQVEDKDAADQTESSDVTEDPLTQGVHRLTFHRPARISATDPAQGRLLVRASDGAGYVAVSRGSGRGEIVVLTQSLWYIWANADEADNAKLLENLLLR